MVMMGNPYLLSMAGPCRGHKDCKGASILGCCLRHSEIFGHELPTAGLSAECWTISEEVPSICLIITNSQKGVVVVASPKSLTIWFGLCLIELQHKLKLDIVGDFSRNPWLDWNGINSGKSKVLVLRVIRLS